MLPFFKAGIGGPVAGGRQYVPWVHVDDVVGATMFALDNEAVSGPVNVTAPEPVTNKELSRTLGRVLRRPAFAPVPALAVKALYGDMAQIVTTGQRAVPAALTTAGLPVQAARARARTRGRHRQGLMAAALARQLHEEPRLDAELAGPAAHLAPAEAARLGVHHRREGMANRPPHGAAGVGQVARDGEASVAVWPVLERLAAHAFRRRAAQVARRRPRTCVGEDRALELGDDDSASAAGGSGSAVGALLRPQPGSRSARSARAESCRARSALSRFVSVICGTRMTAATIAPTSASAATSARILRPRGLSRRTRKAGNREKAGKRLVAVAGAAQTSSKASENRRRPRRGSTSARKKNTNSSIAKKARITKMIRSMSQKRCG